MLAKSRVGLMILACLGAFACDSDDPESERRSNAARIEAALQPPQSTPAREGVAAAVVIDVSGSMKDRVEDDEGERATKIEIARRAAHDLVGQFARYAEDHPAEPVLLGLYEFSERKGKPDCRPVIPMGPPDPAKALAALALIKPDGGTPIGNAVVEAKRELDRTGLSRRHLLVVTDGENTTGYKPADVMEAIARRPASEQPSVYFVAFDIEASRFRGVRDAGGLVLAAANAKELDTTLDNLLRGKILVER